MKKIAFIAAVGVLSVACTKWENKSTEFKVTGLWTGVNQEVAIQALPFLDSNEVMPTTYMEANFMEDGGLTIDSAGVRLDSMGWSIENDSVLLLRGIELGFEDPFNGGTSLVPSDLKYNILSLTQEQFIFRYDTTINLTIPQIPIPVNITVKQIQRWAK